MTADNIFITKEHPVIERPGSRLIDKSTTIMKAIVVASDDAGNEVRCEESEQFESGKDEIAILSELLYRLSQKIKPKKQ